MSTTSTGLVVEELNVSYSGAHALVNVSLRAAAGEITALIGPNGAGKTTLFNAISGLTRPDAGRIVYDEQPLKRRRPRQRAHVGLGRTFQLPQVCPSLTVAENVTAGAEARRCGASMYRQLGGGIRDRHAIGSSVHEAIELCSLSSIASTPVGQLTVGQRRLVELARACAGGYRFVLMDEPSSGLDPQESLDFARILQQIVDAHGTGILLVEHDMALVMGISRTIHVLDYGRLIFTGSPAETRRSDIVRRAYLGEDLSPGEPEEG